MTSRSTVYEVFCNPCGKRLGTSQSALAGTFNLPGACPTCQQINFSVRPVQNHRVEFKLAMPGRASWDGKWSGDGKNYSIVRELSDEKLARLFDLAPGGVDLTACRRIWTHRWSDGWCAQVVARVVPPGEDLPKSDGFNGYDWMVDNILRKGDPHGEVTS